MYSVLVQGPLNRVSIDSIEEYQKIGPVVISAWDSDLRLLAGVCPLGCTVVSKPLPEKQYYVGKPNQTFSYQVHSILNGLKAVTTPYVIRTRSDERYNLQPLIEAYEQRDDVVLCGNIFFKRWSDYPLHMGDHLFIGKTDVLLEAYLRLANHVDKYNNQHCAEQSSSMAILDAFEAGYTREDFLRHFDVIDINVLRPFVANWQFGGQVYLNEFCPDDVVYSKDQI